MGFGAWAALAALTKDGRWLLILGASGSEEPSQLVGINVATGRQAWRHEAPEGVTQTDFVAGTGAVAYIQNGQITFLNPATGLPRDQPAARRDFTCTASSHDGLEFWAGTKDGHVLLLKRFEPPKQK